MPSAEDLFTDVRVVELSTVTRDGGLNTKPMSASWLPDSQQIVLTTPPAYPQKVYNIRRDGRVALLYSDLRGSGLPAGTSVLVPMARVWHTRRRPRDSARAAGRGGLRWAHVRTRPVGRRRVAP